MAPAPSRPRYPPAWSAEKAFAAELAKLRAAENGSRHPTEIGFAIGQMLAAGGWIPEDGFIDAALQDAVFEDEREAFESGLAAGRLEPDWSAAWFEADVKHETEVQRIREEAKRRLRSGGWTEPQRFDLATAVDDLEPEHLGVGDCLLVPSLAWIFGEPESGKSVFAYDAGVRELHAGRDVLLFDAEAGQSDVRQKMRALGATTDDLTRLHAFDVASTDLIANPSWAAERTDGLTTRLAIFDSSAALLTSAGLDENASTEVLRFIVGVARPLTRLGLCVVVLDHVTKDSTASHWPRGSGAKLGEADLAYKVSAPEPFARGRSGRMRLRCEKDRSGFIGRGTQYDVSVTAGADGSLALHASKMTPEQAAAVEESMQKKRPHPAGRVLAALQGGPRTTLELEQALSLDRTSLSRLLNQAKADELVSDDGPRKGLFKSWRLL